MLTAMCREVNNYFIKDKSCIHLGDYSVTDGTITGVSSPFDYLKIGQYFRIVGSDLNDGVYKYTGERIETLKDETFEGAIWAMSVPTDFIALADEITVWVTEYGGAVNSPYQSESFAGYSYSKASGANGGDVSWKSQFKSRLNAYRRVRTLL